MRRIAVIVICTIFALLTHTATAAGDPVTCVKYDDGGDCILTVSTPPHGVGESGGGGTHPVDNPRGPANCVNDWDHNREIPCSDPNSGWWSPDHHCYVKPMVPQPAKSDPVWSGETVGAVYLCTYEGAAPGTLGTSWFWSLTPPVLPAAQVDPAVLAQQIVTSMRLKAINIGIVPDDKPNSVGLIGLPTWMWVDQPARNTFGPLTRTAGAGGVTVTATATVQSIDWNMGDGHVVTCDTAGTPYQDSFGKADSPDCGYRYARTSVGQPNHAYTVSATSHWAVDWRGGGQTGTINLDLTQNAQIRIGEMQVLVIN